MGQSWQGDKGTTQLTNGQPWQNGIVEIDPLNNGQSWQAGKGTAQLTNGQPWQGCIGEIDPLTNGQLSGTPQL